jgi:hypothetical protein
MMLVDLSCPLQMTLRAQHAQTWVWLPFADNHVRFCKNKHVLIVLLTPVYPLILTVHKYDIQLLRNINLTFNPSCANLVAPSLSVSWHKPWLITPLKSSLPDVHRYWASTSILPQPSVPAHILAL